MKKVLSILAVAIIMFSASKASAQISVNAAYIYQSHTFNYGDKDAVNALKDTMNLNGAMVGLTLNVPLIGSVGIAPGAYLTYAQAKKAVKENNSNYTTSNINLKMPFYLNFKIALGVNSDIIIFGGPVFNVGLSTLANYVNPDSGNEVAAQRDLHFDMGGTVGAGIQFYRFRIYAGYNAALIDYEGFKADKESMKKAWEGSTLFAGIGISLGNPD